MISRLKFIVSRLSKEFLTIEENIGKYSSLNAPWGTLDFFLIKINFNTQILKLLKLTYRKKDDGIQELPSPPYSVVEYLYRVTTGLEHLEILKMSGNSGNSWNRQNVMEIQGIYHLEFTKELVTGNFQKFRFFCWRLFFNKVESSMSGVFFSSIIYIDFVVNNFLIIFRDNFFVPNPIFVAFLLLKIWKFWKSHEAVR